MSYYTVTVNEIRIIGRIWYPPIMAAQVKTLRQYDIDNILARSETGALTRGAVESWLDCNAGDFSSVEDFEADIGPTLIPWQSEESECTFFDCMEGPGED